MKPLMTPVDRLPSNRSRKDYEGQAAKILAELPEEVPTLVGSGSYNELSSIAAHLRKVVGKENVVVRSTAKDSQVYELYATKVSF
jgi:hypothetical protein